MSKWIWGSIDSMKMLGQNTVFRRLKREGPLSLSEMDSRPHLNTRQLYDVRTFDIEGTPHRTDPVAYIGQLHSPELVLFRWFEVNRERLQRTGVTKISVSNRLSGEFREAWREVKAAEQLHWMESGGRDPLITQEELDRSQREAVKCPKCGRYWKNLPHHIRTCDGKPHPYGEEETSEASSR